MDIEWGQRRIKGTSLSTSLSLSFLFNSRTMKANSSVKLNNCAPNSELKWSGRKTSWTKRQTMTHWQQQQQKQQQQQQERSKVKSEKRKVQGNKPTNSPSKKCQRKALKIHKKKTSKKATVEGARYPLKTITDTLTVLKARSSFSYCLLTLA